jgi:hypothetical protein
VFQCFPFAKYGKLKVQDLFIVFTATCPTRQLVTAGFAHDIWFFSELHLAACLYSCQLALQAISDDTGFMVSHLHICTAANLLSSYVQECISKLVVHHQHRQACRNCCQHVQFTSHCAGRSSAPGADRLSAVAHS